MPVLEGLGVLAVTLPLAVGLRLPTLWLVVPFAVVTLTRRPYEDFGLTLHAPGSLRFHATVVLVVFGTYSLAHYTFCRWMFGMTFDATLPPHLPRLVFDQFLLIGLSEEFFFRGYLQTLFNRRFDRPYTLLGARWGAGLLLAAILFGLCHLVTGDFSRLRVVFFGLFAGWLRERTGSIAVPAAYHGAANVLYEVLRQSLR